MSAGTRQPPSSADREGPHAGHRLRGALLVTLAVIVGLPIASVGVLLVLWGVSFVDPAPQQDDCAFGSVTNPEYRGLLAQAKSQNWSVWPGLSDGLFWLSDRGLLGEEGGPALESRQGEYFRRSIDQLTFDHNSPDAQLAAAHAVMRSIGAEAVYAYAIPNGKSFDVQFVYFLKQRRFAPLCLHCVPWPFTEIIIGFLRTNSDSLEHITVLHGGLEFDPRKVDRNVEACPAFPARRNQGDAEIRYRFRFALLGTSILWRRLG